MATNDSVRRKTSVGRAGAPGPQQSEEQRQKQLQKQVRSGFAYLAMGLVAAWIVQQLVLMRLLSRALEDHIAVEMCGRAAEQLVFATISTGAFDDIQRASQLARRMVTEFGMSEKLGSVRYAGQRMQYLAGVLSEESEISSETRQMIDAEVRRIVGEQFARAEALFAAHRDALVRLAKPLLESESLDGTAVQEALVTSGPSEAAPTV